MAARSVYITSGDVVLLSQYQLAVAQILQDPPATSLLYATSDITSYINTARVFLAGDTECARANGTLTLAPGASSFSFGAISLPVGYGLPLYLRNIRLTDASGTVYPMFSRPYPWFALYQLNTSSPVSAIPREWSQQGQGTSGTVYFYPLPAVALTATIDLTALPTPLIDDSTPDVIPDPFSNAVAYYAAYLAYLSAQRSQDSQGMFSLYRQFADQARGFANGSVLAYQGAQPRDPAASARYGNNKGAQGA